MFDADKLGKDKSLGSVAINPRDFDSKEAKWFPLEVSEIVKTKTKMVKLINTIIYQIYFRV